MGKDECKISSYPRWAVNATSLLPQPTFFYPSQWVSIKCWNKGRHMSRWRSFSTNAKPQHTKVINLYHSTDFRVKWDVILLWILVIFLLFSLIVSLWPRFLSHYRAAACLPAASPLAPPCAATQEAGYPLNNSTLECVSTHTHSHSRHPRHLIVIIQIIMRKKTH